MSSFCRFFGLCILLAAPLFGAPSEPTETPIAEFAQRIYAVTGQSPTALTVQNVAQLEPDQVRLLQSGIETQLRGLGAMLIASGTPTSQVRITFSRNTRGWLWIAEVQRGPASKIVMLEVPAMHANSGHGTMTLRRQLLITSDEPILDVIRLNPSGTKMLVALTPARLRIYEWNGNSWAEQRTVGLTRTAIMPRDPRGHLTSASDHLFDVYLPGAVCNSSAALPVTVACHDADDLWPLGSRNAFFNANRNYFTGLVRPGFAKPISSFYSATSLPIADRVMWIFADVDGSVRWSDGGDEQLLAGTQEWGSDVAAIHSGCRLGTQVIASHRGDGTSGESLRAYEILNQQATPASAPLPFSGPVTSLWSQAGDSTVTATIRNTKGSYEAYAIELSCD